MRVITVRQPWAWAIIHGQKDVENRTRNIAGSYRGPVAIHAALRYSDEAWESTTLNAAVAFGSNADSHDLIERRGAIIGVVDLVGVHLSATHEERWNAELERREQCSPWAMVDHYHLELANPRPIDPIPAKGKLGLWRPDAELLAQIEASL